MTPEQATALVESREVFGMRFGLDRMRRTLDELGRPHRAAPAVHVVGTNGKSSTARFAAAALGAWRGPVGCYVSPHVVDWRERMMIDGNPIAPERFATAVGRVADAEARWSSPSWERLTQFELLTAAAFVAFADRGVAAMVVEAGLGGRFDATNVFDGAACVALTGIALEHTDLLGATEREIAAEKLAVCPDGYRDLVVGPLRAAAEEAVQSICRDRDLDGWIVGRDIRLVEHAAGRFSVGTPLGDHPDLRLSVLGGFQRANATLGVAAAECLAGRHLDTGQVRAVLERVRVPGRLEVLDTVPTVILDGAHNPDGMRALVASLEAAVGARPLVAVVGVFDDKDVGAMARELATVCRRAVATSAFGARALSAGQVADALEEAGVRVDIEAEPLRALGRARTIAGDGGVVLVCGSLALLAEVRTGIIEARTGDPGMLAGGNPPEAVDKPER